MTGVIGSLGARGVAAARTGADAASLWARTLRAAWEERGPHGGLILGTALRQIRFTGLDALGLVAVAAVGLGVITTLQVDRYLRELSMAGFSERVVVFVLVRELPAILVNWILIARSGTAVATELANLRLNREIDPIVAHGIPAEVLVVLPRLIAFPIASFCLTFDFAALALLGGAVAEPLLGAGASGFSLGVALTSAGPVDLLLPAVKSLLFGTLTVLICCSAGLGVRRSFREVPQAATRAVSASFVSCMLVNALLSVAALA